MLRGNIVPRNLYLWASDFARSSASPAQSCRCAASQEVLDLSPYRVMDKHRGAPEELAGHPVKVEADTEQSDQLSATTSTHAPAPQNSGSHSRQQYATATIGPFSVVTHVGQGLGQYHDSVDPHAHANSHRSPVSDQNNSRKQNSETSEPMPSPRKERRDAKMTELAHACELARRDSKKQSLQNRLSTNSLRKVAESPVWGRRDETGEQSLMKVPDSNLNRVNRGLYRSVPSEAVATSSPTKSSSISKGCAAGVLTTPKRPRSGDTSPTDQPPTLKPKQAADGSSSTKGFNEHTADVSAGSSTMPPEIYASIPQGIKKSYYGNDNGPLASLPSSQKSSSPSASNVTTTPKQGTDSPSTGKSGPQAPITPRRRDSERRTPATANTRTQSGSPEDRRHHRGGSSAQHPRMSGSPTSQSTRHLSTSPYARFRTPERQMSPRARRSGSRPSPYAYTGHADRGMLIDQAERRSSGSPVARQSRKPTPSVRETPVSTSTSPDTQPSSITSTPREGRYNSSCRSASASPRSTILNCGPGIYRPPRFGRTQAKSSKTPPSRETGKSRKGCEQYSKPLSIQKGGVSKSYRDSEQQQDGDPANPWEELHRQGLTSPQIHAMLLYKQMERDKAALERELAKEQGEPARTERKRPEGKTRINAEREDAKRKEADKRQADLGRQRRRLDRQPAQWERNLPKKARNINLDSNPSLAQIQPTDMRTGITPSLRIHRRSETLYTSDGEELPTGYGGYGAQDQDEESEDEEKIQLRKDYDKESYHQR